MKKVYAFLADGFEEVEALMVIDLMKRSGKIDVDMVSISEELTVRGSHNIKVMADTTIDKINFEEGHMIFLPGGMPGTNNLAACSKLTENIIKYNKEGKALAAICAAPSVLGELGILKGKKATCYPGFEGKLEGAIIGGNVVTDGNVTTGKGLGVALEMGIELVSILADKETSDSVAKAIQYI